MRAAMDKKSARIRSREICQQMLDEGVIPTQQEVRKRLLLEEAYNNPSVNDIRQGIKEFWDDHFDWIKGVKTRPETPDEVVNLANELFAKVHQQVEAALSERETAVAERERSSEMAISGLQEELEQAKRLIQEQSSENRIQKAELDAANQSLELLKKELAKRERSLERYKKQAEQAQASLEQNIERQDETLSQWRKVMEAAQNAAKVKDDELRERNKEFSKLSSDNSKKDDLITALQKQLEEMTSECEELAEENIGAKQQLDHTEAELKETKRLLRSARRENTILKKASSKK